MGYTPPGEEVLLSSLSAITLIEPVVYKEEPLQPAPIEKSKRVRGKKDKDGAAFVRATQSSTPTIKSTALVLTRFATKVAAKASAALESTPISAAVGSLSVAPSIVLAVASQSEAIVPSLRKRKVAVLDANVTSSGTIPIFVVGLRGVCFGKSRGVWLLLVMT